ncbi:hypothetical protein PIB30_048485 [Stylosanthes scabra]|uniref:Wall-associated receptor kinase galacturonan-binding domain-containing protein n=1 Tax=Stylosanthes scabra TaxID=79078 RepID=A0ABU6RH32_9FABA|nr:hypothetical protein [Stylosanthes scabra]
MVMRRGKGFLLLIILLQQILSCRGGGGGCSPSSCGKISNIRYPFRLKDDPVNCGDQRYELSCENNITLLQLFPGKSYHVKAINYNNFTIRLVDPAISENDCSTLPRYSLSRSNFSDSHRIPTPQIPKGVNNETYASFQYRVSSNGSTQVATRELFNHVIFLNCSNPISRDDDSRFVDASPCFDEKGGHHHVYAGVEGLRVVELRDDCRVTVAASSSIFGPSHRNLSYGEIHRRLSYGFELSWMLGSVCALCDWRGSATDFKICYFDEAYQSIGCDIHCSVAEADCSKKKITI